MATADNLPAHAMNVIFIGNLAGGAYMMARPVANAGVRACLMLASWEKDLANPDWEGRSNQEPRGLTVVRYGGEIPVQSNLISRLMAHVNRALSYVSHLPHMLRADIIQSFTCSLFVSRIWFLVFGVLRLRPYIACATGSDLRELATTGKGFNAWLCRQFFRRAALVLLLNLDMVRIADRLGLTNARFFPFSVDTGLFEPVSVAKTYGNGEGLFVFMPSHLDWGVRDNALGRSSTKGNDKLIRAFARFIAERREGHLLMLDRGPDRDLARQLVEDLGIAQHVSFRDQMTKRELVEHFNMADVVADQFDIGAFGTTTLEAMACSKPVLAFVDMECADRCYSDRPPVLNAQTENEILDALRRAAEPDYRSALGCSARDWVIRHHDASHVAARLIDLYRSIVGSR